MVALACYRALDAVGMSWDNMHLKNILSSDSYCSHVPDSSLISGSFNSLGQPLWHGKYKILPYRRLEIVRYIYQFYQKFHFDVF